jgi:hypothetical protein
MLSFIASASNSAAATTLNANSLGAKSVYKPGGTNAPNIISGKAYTVWYDSGDDCFFIKASAEGGAVAASVLVGETFSNDSDTGIIGTMPNWTGLNPAPASTSVAAITLKVYPQAGYYDGSTAYANVEDADFTAANIKKGVDLFGITGTYNNIADFSAGNNIQAKSNDVVTKAYSGTVKAKEIQVARAGTYRVSFDLMVESYGGGSGGQGVIYKNGVSYGTVRYKTNNTYGTFTEDLTFLAGDLVQLYINANDAGETAYTRNFQIKTAEDALFVINL